MRLRLGPAFIDERRQPKQCSLDAESRFERTRVLDPPPYEPILRQTRDSIVAAFPAFRETQVAERWGG